MNILPQQLKGKTIKDCYLSDTYEVTIEFTDGTKIKIVSERTEVRGRNHYSTEDFIVLSI